MKKIKTAFFIGIGGAGMSGIARVFNDMGIKVSGSDIKDSTNTDNLRSLGIEVVIGHNNKNINDPDIVVISTAIHKDNPELIESTRKSIPVWHRAKALAYIASQKKTIAVCGTHGKTTTTSMTSLLLEDLGQDPTFLIGGELNDIGSNAKFGKGDWLVAEADESDGSLINIHPEMMIITNVEADHLDFFKDYDEIEDLFIKFVGQVPDDGIVIYNGDYENLHKITERPGIKRISFGFEPTNDFRLEGEKVDSFKLYQGKKLLGTVDMLVYGKHNALNAAASMICALSLGYDFKEAAKSISRFSGVSRRFQKYESTPSLFVADDYAHHPTEIKATLSTARKKLDGRLICVFQPHRFSRTMLLGDLFADSFKEADLLILTDVYAAGEYPIPGITGKYLLDKVLDKGKTQVAYMPTLNDTIEYLQSVLESGDNLITMGAGDIWQVAKKISESLVLS